MKNLQTVSQIGFAGISTTTFSVLALVPWPRHNHEDRLTGLQCLHRGREVIIGKADRKGNLGGFQKPRYENLKA